MINTQQLRQEQDRESSIDYLNRPIYGTNLYCEVLMSDLKIAVRSLVPLLLTMHYPSFEIVEYQNSPYCNITTLYSRTPFIPVGVPRY